MGGKIGRIHSFESFGAVDGPGIRYVVFLQGCLLRCLYCHNPDTWECAGGIEISSDALIEKILSYKSFIYKGGVTLSGGEPLLQSEFCEEIIEKCHENGLHVAIDTCGAVPLEKSKNAILKSDLILLDIKDIDDNDCKTLTGQGNLNAIETLDFCEHNNKSVWIRHVLLPEYTLNFDKLKQLGAFLKNYKCIERVELLPYHTMGLDKWHQLGIKSRIEDIQPPTDEEITCSRETLQEFGLNVY